MIAGVNNLLLGTLMSHAWLFTFANEILYVLSAVVGKSAACVFIALNQRSQAQEVCGNKLIEAVFAICVPALIKTMSWSLKEVGKDLIDHHHMVHLIHQFNLYLS